MLFRNRRGIILIISLILSVVLVLFIAAARQLGLGNLSENRHSKNALAAENAANSGLEYCRAQLRHDPTWRGDRNATTVNLPDLIVIEDQGNIAGLVRSTDGTWSQFRCRFNFQDGAGGADGFPDDPAFQVDMTRVSVSNIVGFGPRSVPLADGANFSVTETSEISHQIPTWSAYLAVEGRAGLRDVDPSRPEVPYDGVVRTIESVLSVSAGDEPIVDAAGMAGGEVIVDLGSGPGNLTVSAESGTPRLRSKGEANLTGGGSENYVSVSGEVRTPSATLGANYDTNEVTVEAELPDDPFYQLTYSDVRKAGGGATLPGGTYVWWDDGSIHYYDMSYDDYLTYMSDPNNLTDPGVTNINFPPSAQVDNSGGVQKLVITGDVQVTSSSNGVDSFAVIPRGGAAEVPPGDPEAASGGAVDVAALAQHLGSNDGLWADFMRSTQNPSGGDLGLLVGGGIWMDWGGSGPDFSISPDTAAARTALLNALVNPSSYNWDSPPPVAIDTADLDPVFVIDDGSGTIDLGSEEDSLTASDVALEFSPTNGGSAILSADGDIRLTGSVDGEGGSIVSGGQIRVTGVGSSFASAENPVNMYAQGDIFLSTLDEVNTSPGTYVYADLNLKGIVYTQGDLITRLGSETLPNGDWGTLTVDGVVVAYGGDPQGEPGVSGGNFDFRASQVNLNYSRAYLGALGVPAAGFGLDIAAWSNRI